MKRNHNLSSFWIGINAFTKNTPEVDVDNNNTLVLIRPRVLLVLESLKCGKYDFTVYLLEKLLIDIKNMTI